MARVAVFCERSGVVRRAFRDAGHDAWSIDIEEADDGSPYHIRGDATKHLRDGWDLAIMHPPCTYLCNSGVRWRYEGGRKENGLDVGRGISLYHAAWFYRTLRDAAWIPRRAVENPIMHRDAVARTRRGDVQFVQPWWFGDPYFKATGWELIGLPKLEATDRLTPPAPGTDEHKAWSRVHREPPGPDRAKRRSETFPGLAAAMAAQWGPLLP